MRDRANYQIMLVWSDTYEIEHEEEMDCSCYPSNVETYHHLVSECERCIEVAIERYGNKEWVYHYSPYHAIILKRNNKTVKVWTVSRYLRERRK